jgi:hypothetical protein
MNTDNYLLDKFNKSDICDVYGFTVEEIVEDQVPEIMYEFLANLAEKSVMNVEEHEKVFKVLQYNLVEEFCKQIPPHEGILVLQSMMGGKFYRDHLRHMLRVMLLAHIISDTLRLDKNKLLACTLAGLFHDIAYPLSKAKETIDTITKSLRRCYPYFEIKGGSLQLSPNQDEIDKILKICKEKELNNLRKGTNHAILSALTFLNFWNLESLEKDENLREIICLATHAIAIHDSGIKGIVKYSKDPVSTILILADELQDWGRPVGWDESSWIAIPNIEPFLISKERIRATFDYSKTSEYYEKTFGHFSPLLQIYSKQENMSRIVLNGHFPALSLTYKLPTYRVLSKDLVLSYVKKIEKYEILVPGTNMTLEEFLMTGGAVMKNELPPRFMVLHQLQYWLTDFYNRVAKSTFPLYLHYNRHTGEYVIYGDEQMPSEIITHKNGKGKMGWDYDIIPLEKPLMAAHGGRITFGLKIGRFWDFFREYPIHFYEGMDKLERINNSQIVESFMTLLQLLPLLFLTGEEIVEKGFGKRCKDFDLAEEAIDAFEVLWHSYDRGCHFFLLESSKG